MKPKKTGRPKLPKSEKRVDLRCKVHPRSFKILSALAKSKGGIGQLLDGFAATIPKV